MIDFDQAYSFVFRGLLAEEALDAAGRLPSLSSNATIDETVAQRLSIDLLDKEIVAKASTMAAVYTAVASFENSVRRLISTVLLEEVGVDWWQTSVSEKIRAKAESRRDEESKVRWHAPRGEEPLNYAEFGDLVSIMTQNWEKFEPFVRSLEWARQLIVSVERSRNVIMHSGELEMEDVERIGGLIRDWVKQVGT
jgi:hypothetical protein